MMRFILIALPLALTTVACDNSGSGTTPTTTTPQTFATEIFAGTVPPLVDGVRQSVFNNFTVGQGGGQISVTLTSAVLTRPGGTLDTTVSLGVAVGAASGTTCTPLANASAIAQASSAAILSGSVAAGAYCVQLSDVTNQVGPVAYAVAVVHP